MCVYCVSLFVPKIFAIYYVDVRAVSFDTKRMSEASRSVAYNLYRISREVREVSSQGFFLAKSLTLADGTKRETDAAHYIEWLIKQRQSHCTDIQLSFPNI